MRAIILLSGGLDSCVALASALKEGRDCLTLSFDYGQRHKIELKSAQKIAKYYQVHHQIVRIDPALFSETSSSLVHDDIDVEAPPHPNTIPNTYVPGRNLLFLSHAATYAEIHNASEIHFAANAEDASNYPDCSSEFIVSLEKTTAYFFPVKLCCPLIHLTKAEIIQLGNQLNAPIDLTWSCYNPQEEKPCGQCLACSLRTTYTEVNSKLGI